MSLSFKFAIISDLHIALPHTIWEHPDRFHLVELSIPALESIFADLAQLDLDFLLLPGDLTQHGEAENHSWLAERLTKLPYPTYVIPGNHDVPTLDSLDKFAPHYSQFGYEGSQRLYYECQLLPQVRLIGLNSNHFDEEGKQTGYLNREQLDWLETTLAQYTDDLILVMVHHNILEHMPNQAQNPLGRRYIISNADEFCDILHRGGAKLVFTGHFHVQDIAYSDRYDLYDITTGSIVSYPHPYRVLQYIGTPQAGNLHIHSYRVKSLPGYPDLQHFSREWMGDRSHPYMMKLLTHPPFNLPIKEAVKLTPALRYFWATVAAGNPKFNFPEFPPVARHYFEAFNSDFQGDNDITLEIAKQVKQP